MPYAVKFNFKVYLRLFSCCVGRDRNYKTVNRVQYISEYDCQIHSGNTGKIAAVKYTVDIQGEKHLMIDCIREDIPYMVSGCFDSNLEISSGDVALWTANSLEADENFIAEDSWAKKNS